jgi:hypothetical protein
MTTGRFGGSAWRGKSLLKGCERAFPRFGGEKTENLCSIFPDGSIRTVFTFMEETPSWQK